MSKLPAATAAPTHHMIIRIWRLTLNIADSYPLMSSSNPLRYRRVFPHLEHLLYSLKSNSLYVRKENDSLWAQNTLYKACKSILIANRNRWFFTISLSMKINMPSVRFELTTARSSASLLNISSRVLSQAELRRQVSNVPRWFIYNLVSSNAPVFVQDKFRYYLLVIWFLEL